jgi:hypothetical protein
MSDRLRLGTVAFAYCVLVAVALVPIGGNMKMVDGRQEVDWWTLGSAIVGYVVARDPIKLTLALWIVIAFILAGVGASGARLLRR